MLHKNTTEKRKYQRHDWAKHIKQWQESGLSQSEYCRQNNLSVKLFSLRKRKILNSKPDTKKFIKISPPVNTDSSFSYEYEIILQGNIRIRVSRDFNPEKTKNLIRVLKEL